MPQIWATYDELGAYLGLDGEAARRQAIVSGLARRRCSDGLSRVKLPHALAVDLLATLPEFATTPAAVAVLPGNAVGPEAGAEAAPLPLDEVADLCVARLRDLQAAFGTVAEAESAAA